MNNMETNHEITETTINNHINLKIRCRVMLQILNTAIGMDVMEEMLSEDSNVPTQEIIEVGDHLVELFNKLEIDVSDSFLKLLGEAKKN